MGWEQQSEVLSSSRSRGLRVTPESRAVGTEPEGTLARTSPLGGTRKGNLPGPGWGRLGLRAGQIWLGGQQEWVGGHRAQACRGQKVGGQPGEGQGHLHRPLSWSLGRGQLLSTWWTCEPSTPTTLSLSYKEDFNEPQ